MNTECADKSAKCLSLKVLQQIIQGEDSQNVDYEQTFQKALQNFKCHNESCLLQRAFESKKIDKHTAQQEFQKLLPFGPKTNKNLISDSDLENVTKLYQKKHPRYQHISSIMRDIWDITQWKQISAQEIADTILLQKNKDSFSIICNTDYHDGNGIHWFCIFIHIQDDKFCIEVFDSQRSNNRIEKEFKEFLRQLKMYLDVENIKWTSDGLHQKGDSECGVYTLYYIQQRLDNHYADHNIKKRITDNDMYEYRKKIFREYGSQFD